jgi:hypothetical protein
MRVGAQLSESMAGEYIVKAATKGEKLIPRTLHKGVIRPSVSEWASTPVLIWKRCGSVRGVCGLPGLRCSHH